MGLRFRKSVKVLPGVRINFNKSSTSVTFGPKGLKHTVSSTGRRTTTAGLPGTGLSYSVSSKKPGVSEKQTQPAPQPSTPSAAYRRRKFWIPIVFWLFGAYYLGYDLLALYCLLTGVTTFQDFWVPEVFQKFFIGAALAAVGTFVFLFLRRKTKAPSVEPTQDLPGKPEQDSSVEPAQVVSGKPERIASVETTQVSSSKPERVVSVETAQVSSRKPERIASVETTQVSSSKPEQVSTVETTRVSSSKPAQVASVERTPREFPRITVPKRVGNQIILYHYHNIRFTPADDAQIVAEQIAADHSFELSVSMDGEQAVISYRGGRLGTLIDRIDMVRDWLSKGDLVRVWLENYGDSGNYLFLAFYRDEERRLSFRENTVVKLIRYANEDAQLSIMDIEKGDKLDFDEDIDSQGNDIIHISYGFPIGDLPKKAAQRYLDEGAAAVFFDHVDYDDVKDIAVPHVKIYW